MTDQTHTACHQPPAAVVIDELRARAHETSSIPEKIEHIRTMMELRRSLWLDAENRWAAGDVEDSF